MKRIEKAIRKVFNDRLGDRADRIIEQSLWEGDPYGWASGAIATISLEYGLPGMYDVNGFGDWAKVSDELGNLYVEFVNGGVAAVFEV